MKYSYKEIKEISRDDLNDLYSDNGWTLYTRDIDSLQRAIANSIYVKSIWFEDKLIGLVRVISDDESIAYIQDILILKAHQGRGLGTVLLEDVLDRFKHVRQKTLLTGISEKQARFYKKSGFYEPIEDECVAFVRHDL